MSHYQRVLLPTTALLLAVLMCVTAACQQSAPPATMSQAEPTARSAPAQPTINPQVIECSDVPEMKPLTEREQEAVVAAGCADWIERPTLRQGEADNIRTNLNDRSFRQFLPDRNANPRKGVTIDFFSGIKIYAQYGVDGHAVNEWEIHADDYNLETGDSHNVITLHPIEPRTTQRFPTECSNCIDTTGVSVSVRNAFNPSLTEFRINDPSGVLPPPFPVFGDWTTFREDEIQQ